MNINTAIISGAIALVSGILILVSAAGSVVFLGIWTAGIFWRKVKFKGAAAALSIFFITMLSVSTVFFFLYHPLGEDEERKIRSEIQGAEITFNAALIDQLDRLNNFSQPLDLGYVKTNRDRLTQYRESLPKDAPDWQKDQTLQNPFDPGRL